MPTSHPFIQRDTRAWQLQVWASFAIAVLLCATGLAWLPGEPLARAFMVMGYVFCLLAAFVLAKFVRDSQAGAASGSGPVRGGDVPQWRLVVWGGFATAMGLTAWGLWGMAVHPTYKAFLAVSWLYLITCAFTLAKMLRDRHEADALAAHLAARQQGAPQALRDAAP